MAIKCCRGCKERSPGCHSTCEKYIQEKSEYEKEKAWEKANRERTIHKGAFLGDDGLCKYRPSNYRHK